MQLQENRHDNTKSYGIVTQNWTACSPPPKRAGVRNWNAVATQSKASVKKTMKRDMIRGKGQDDRTDVVEELLSAEQIRLQQNPDFCNSRILG